MIGSDTIDEWYSITDITCEITGWSVNDVCQLIPFELIIYSSKAVERRKKIEEQNK